jgi:hypothetical protein
MKAMDKFLPDGSEAWLQQDFPTSWLETTELVNLGKFQSERSLRKTLQEFWSEGSRKTMLLMQADAVRHEPHLLLCREVMHEMEIEYNKKHLKTQKEQAIVLHMRRFDEDATDRSFQMGFLSDWTQVVVDRLEGTEAEQKLLDAARKEVDLRTLLLSDEGGLREKIITSLPWCLRRIKYPHPRLTKEKKNRTRMYIEDAVERLSGTSQILDELEQRVRGSIGKDDVAMRRGELQRLASDQAALVKAGTLSMLIRRHMLELVRKPLTQLLYALEQRSAIAILLPPAMGKATQLGKRVFQDTLGHVVSNLPTMPVSYREVDSLEISAHHTALEWPFSGMFAAALLQRKPRFIRMCFVRDCDEGSWQEVKVEYFKSRMSFYLLLDPLVANLLGEFRSRENKQLLQEFEEECLRIKANKELERLLPADANTTASMFASAYATTNVTLELHAIRIMSQPKKHAVYEIHVVEDVPDSTPISRQVSRRWSALRKLDDEMRELPSRVGCKMPRLPHALDRNAGSLEKDFLAMRGKELLKFLTSLCEAHSVSLATNSGPQVLLRFLEVGEEPEQLQGESLPPLVQVGEQGGNDTFGPLQPSREPTGPGTMSVGNDTLTPLALRRQLTPALADQLGLNRLHLQTDGLDNLMTPAAPMSRIEQIQRQATSNFANLIIDTTVVDAAQVVALQQQGQSTGFFGALCARFGSAVKTCFGGLQPEPSASAQVEEEAPEVVIEEEEQASFGDDWKAKLEDGLEMAALSQSDADELDELWKRNKMLYRRDIMAWRLCYKRFCHAQDTLAPHMATASGLIGGICLRSGR